MSSNRTKYTSTPTYGMHATRQPNRQPVPPQQPQQQSQQPYPPQSTPNGYPNQQQGYPPYPQQGNGYPQQNAYPGYNQPPFYQQADAAYGGQNYQSPNVNTYQTPQGGMGEQQIPQPAGYQPGASPYTDYSQQAYGYPQYAQQGYPPQQGWQTPAPQQGMQPPVQQPPAQQPRQSVPRNNTKGDAALGIVMLLVLPLCFLAGMLFGQSSLKFAFVIGAIVTLLYMWVRKSFASSARSTITLVYAALLVIIGVNLYSSGALTDPVALGGGTNDNNTVQSGGVSNNEATPTITADPVVTPSPTPAGISEVETQLNSFMQYWAVSNYDYMLSLCAPSWLNAQKETKYALFALLANRIPREYKIEKISGSDNDTTRTITLAAVIDKQNGKSTSTYRIAVVMLKESGTWYVDPSSLVSNEVLGTEDPSSPTPDPTATPLYTVAAEGTVLYYNPNGGSMYHADQYCSSVRESLLPLTPFYFSQLDEAPYSSLSRCTKCNAPPRK